MTKSYSLIIAFVLLLQIFLTGVIYPKLINPPVLIFPIDTAVEQSTTLLFRWHSVSDATSYDLQVSTDSSFNTHVDFSYDSISDTSKLIASLSRETQYFWRVRAKENQFVSGWSNRWSFTTIVSPPAPPTQSLPLDGFSGVSTTPVLTWNNRSNTLLYRLQVSLDSTFSLTLYDSSGITIDSQQVRPQLKFATTYYWRVNAANSGGTSQWSDTWSFITATAAGLPIGPRQVSPPNGMNNEPITTTLQWNTVLGATRYELQLSLVQDFSSTTFYNSNIIGTSQQIRF